MDDLASKRGALQALIKALSLMPEEAAEESMDMDKLPEGQPDKGPGFPKENPEKDAMAEAAPSKEKAASLSVKLEDDDVSAEELQKMKKLLAAKGLI